MVEEQVYTSAFARLLKSAYVAVANTKLLGINRVSIELPSNAFQKVQNSQALTLYFVTFFIDFWCARCFLP